ncbi:MAG TPA: sarcosine oxidase subunit gamma family protein [Burkholderiales bacterium]|nr:sarcosine oxidase subunit gamma family protein [Burkholderiales bacterium]
MVDLRWSLRLPSPLLVDGFALDMPVNRASRNGQRLAARLGPDEWLLVAPAGEAPDFSALEGRHHSLVDVSHRYATFAVEGDSAPLILAAGCPLDLHPDFFTPGSATRTLLGKAEIILWRLGEAPSYRVECARSFAGYVERFLDQERSFTR